MGYFSRVKKVRYRDDTPEQVLRGGPAGRGGAASDSASGHSGGGACYSRSWFRDSSELNITSVTTSSVCITTWSYPRGEWTTRRRRPVKHMNVMPTVMN